MSAATVAALLDEMDEYYSAFDYYPLYLLGWELNDGIRTPTQKHDLAQRAYDEFTSTRNTKIVWTKWPIDLEAAWPLEPGAPLVFDLDPDGPAGQRLQVLVPA